MGIDVYLEWQGQTDAEEQAQFTGYRTDAGHLGYLREAYHGGPYVTRHLVGDAFDEDKAIPAATLRDRLPAAILLALYRHEIVYGTGTDPGLITAEPACDIITLARQTIARAAHEARQADDIVAGITPEQLRHASTLIAARRLPPHALAFVDFVELAERVEAKTGQPCIVHVSY